MKKYRLFYRDIELGEITQEDVDFPNLLGTFQPTGGTAGGELRDKLGRYIEYSIAADRVMMERGEEEWERFVQDNEAQFVDLIETEDWYVLAEGQKEPILVPTFYQDSEIVWRWNFLGPGGGGTVAV